MIERVMQLIKQSGLSDNAFEKQLHLSQGTVGNWRSGRNKLSMEAIIKLARYFNVSADYLLGLTDDRRPLLEAGVVVPPTAIGESAASEIAARYKHLFEDADFVKVATVYDSVQIAAIKGLLVGYFLAAAKSSGVDTSIVGY